MIKKLFLIILFALLLCSCQKENKYKVYMKNGNIIYAWYVHSNNVGRTEIIDNFYDDVRVSYDTYYRYEKGDRVCFILEKNLLPAWVFVILCFAIIISFIWLILVIISIFDSKNVQP